MLSVTSKSPKPHAPRTPISPTTQTFKTKTGGTTLNSEPSPTITVGSVVNISRATGNQTEADIAINPTNPNFIYAVSNVASGSVLFTSRSSDGGVTWTTNGSAFSGACCDA